MEYKEKPPTEITLVLDVTISGCVSLVVDASAPLEGEKLKAAAVFQMRELLNASGDEPSFVDNITITEVHVALTPPSSPSTEQEVRTLAMDHLDDRSARSRSRGERTTHNGRNKMKMRTADLIGAALDWAAAKVLGIETYGPEDFRNLRNCTTKNGEYVYRWSQSWAQTGPIIEERGMTLMRRSDGEWAAEINNRPRCYGPTPMVAAMRSLVHCYFGATVEIPDELL